MQEALANEPPAFYFYYTILWYTWPLLVELRGQRPALADKLCQAINLVQTGNAWPKHKFIYADICERLEGAFDCLGCGWGRTGYHICYRTQEGVVVLDVSIDTLRRVWPQPEIGAGNEARFA